MRYNIFKKNIILPLGCSALAILLGLVAVFFVLKAAKESDIGQESSSFFSETGDMASLPEEPAAGLVITSPASLNTTITTSKTVIIGTSDIAFPLMLNGNEVERSNDGSFSLDVELKRGANTFVFEHKGVTTTCKINYRFVVISAYSPSKQEKYPSGSTFVVSAEARVGSKVTALFNGVTVTLDQASDIENKEFVSFTGSFTLPNTNDADMNLGKVVFTGSFDGTTEKFSSGNIICLKNEILASRSYVAEITAFTA